MVAYILGFCRLWSICNSMNPYQSPAIEYKKPLISGWEIFLCGAMVLLSPIWFTLGAFFIFAILPSFWYINEVSNLNPIMINNRVVNMKFLTLVAFVQGIWGVFYGFGLSWFILSIGDKLWLEH